MRTWVAVVLCAALGCAGVERPGPEGQVLMPGGCSSAACVDEYYAGCHHLGVEDWCACQCMRAHPEGPYLDCISECVGRVR